MAAGILPAALGHVRHDRRDERLADRARDLVGRVLHDELVLAVHHVRALLLGARGADDDGRPAGLDGVAHFRPGQIFDEDAVGRFAGGAVAGASAGRWAAKGSDVRDMKKMKDVNFLDKKILMIFIPLMVFM